MKKSFCWTLAVLMLLTGCAAPAATTSETEETQSQEPQGMLLSTLEVPERFTGDWTGVEGLVTVHADAVVELPKVDTIPIATVKRRSFTDEDAEKLITFFCGDAPFNKPVSETKQSAQARLDRYEAIKRGEMEATGDLVDHIRVDGEAYLDKRIADYQKILETAPDENERIPASRKFVPDDFFASKVDGFAELPGKTVRINLHNAPADQPWTEACAFVEGYGTLNGPQYYALEDSQTPTCGLTREQAVQAGDELMAALGTTDLVCVQSKGIMFTVGEPYVLHNSEDDSTIPVEDKEGGYELTYRRKVEDLPISVTSDAGSWPCEEVTVAVADQGVVWFRWDSPYETPTVTSYAQELISFQEAAEIFAKMMMVTHQNRLEINQRNDRTIREHYDIDRVSLDYVRIRDKDNLKEGTLIPVWNFWGIETRSTDEHPDWTYTDEENVLLTVNALDGSIIDLSYGY